MGDIKKLKKKFASPRHPWSKRAIEVEGKLVKEYGLGKKREIYTADAVLKKYKTLAKKLIAKKTIQGEIEKQQILARLQRLGLLPVGTDLSNILALETKNVLDRRAQSIVFKRGFARSIKQARQFIVHRHILLGDKEVTSPSKLLTQEEESRLNFKKSSTLDNENHPERINLQAQKIHEEAETVRKAQKQVTENTGGKGE